MSKRNAVSETRIRLAIHQALSDLQWRGRRACIVYRRNVGVYRHLHAPGMITIGIPGQADLAGFLCNGLAFEVEVKSASGVLEPDQVAWRQTCLDFCVLHIVATRVEDATLAVIRELENWAGMPGEPRWDALRILAEVQGGVA